MTHPTAGEVAALAAEARAAQSRLEDAIRQMSVEGASLRAIAEAAGISHQTVKHIVSGLHGHGQEGGERE